MYEAQEIAAALGLDLAEGAVLVRSLAYRANHEGECWPSRATIAADTGLSVPSVQRAVARLRKHRGLPYRARRSRYGLHWSGFPQATVKKDHADPLGDHSDLSHSAQMDHSDPSDGSHRYRQMDHSDPQTNKGTGKGTGPPRDLNGTATVDNRPGGASWAPGLGSQPASYHHPACACAGTGWLETADANVIRCPAERITV